MHITFDSPKNTFSKQINTLKMYKNEKELKMKFWPQFEPLYYTIRCIKDKH